MTSEGVKAKLAILRDDLERLEQIPQATLPEFLADFRNLDSALHRLQTSIQALINVATFVASTRGLGPLSSSIEALEKLEGHALLPAGATARFAPIFGFRNRVVHLYDRIDPAIVFKVLTEHRSDIVDLAKMLTAALTAAP